MSKVLTEPEALKLRDEIVNICKKYNQWVVDTYERKPFLKMIRIELSIKVDHAAQARTNR